MDACVRCSTAAPSVDYCLEYKGRKGQDNASGFQATFSLVQQRKDRSKMVDTYLTTYNITLPEYAPVRYQYFTSSSTVSLRWDAE